jgi:signal transduction histidine kinase
LAGLFKSQLPELASVIGPEKSQAVISLLDGTVQSLRQTNQQLSSYVTDQFNIIAHIQEILSIQRHYTALQQSQQRALVNVRSVINDALTMLLGTIEKKGICISLDLAHQVPLIKADHTKLVQVLLNLLKNSIDSIDIDIGEKHIHIRLFLVNASLNIEIQDNGSGFDAHTGEKLFQRGFTTKYSGSGLGLANCKSIIDSHNGLINITSPGPGQGTRAEIKFKLQPTT